MDGHADFYQPEAEPNGEAASMDLALATGRGPSIVTNLEGLAPLVRDEDTVAVGRRDLKDTEEYGSQRIEESGICVIDFNMIQTVGATAAARQAIDWLEQTPIDGFWLHLDADVLDDRIMPAVDYRMPGGLSYEDLTTFLSASMATGRVVGINITILNPKLDHDGTITRMFAKVLWDGLAQLPEPV
jgi:arginase